MIAHISSECMRIIAYIFSYFLALASDYLCYAWDKQVLQESLVLNLIGAGNK